MVRCRIASQNTQQVEPESESRNLRLQWTQDDQLYVRMTKDCGTGQTDTRKTNSENQIRDISGDLKFPPDGVFFRCQNEDVSRKKWTYGHPIIYALHCCLSAPLPHPSSHPAFNSINRAAGALGSTTDKLQEK